MQGRIAYYADFAVYPVLIVASTLVIAGRSSPRHPVLALGFAVAGVVLWTLLEYFLHRFVLHGDTYIASLHEQHHAWPRAWIGTPTWLSVTAITCIAFLPVLFGAPPIASLSLALGLMAGFFWYGLTHHAIHHGQPQRLARALAVTARRHFKHHCREGSGNFGVTTSLWDRLFQTSLSDAARVPHPEATNGESRLGGEG
jgi:sterol desaturase/sphingolipid hydroxylase (fatty acid hydroxylase superfamily)